MLNNLTSRRQKETLKRVQGDRLLWNKKSNKKGE